MAMGLWGYGVMGLWEVAKLLYLLAILLRWGSLF